MIKLGVNIDHIATLRQARLAVEPDPVAAAVCCENAGADGITVHLREDRRHIQDHDVEALRRAVSTKLNLEMAVTDEMVRIACRVKPDDVCLVPEKRQELTTEGGLDAAGNTEALAAAIRALKNAGITVSVFINPDDRQITACADAGADAVELHTGAYAEECKALSGAELERLPSFKRLSASAAYARARGLAVNAGHGLDYINVKPVACIPGMQELNIGFSIIARAVFVGLDRAVKEMKDRL